MNSWWNQLKAMRGHAERAPAVDELVSALDELPGVKTVSSSDTDCSRHPKMVSCVSPYVFFQLEDLQQGWLSLDYLGWLAWQTLGHREVWQIIAVTPKPPDPTGNFLQFMLVGSPRSNPAWLAARIRSMRKTYESYLKTSPYWSE